MRCLLVTVGVTHTPLALPFFLIPSKAQFLGGKELVTENKFVFSYGCNAVHSGLDASV